jgi:hypothetical protein
MKVAVLLTGALRTIRKTITYFKKNVILTPDVDIFACVQNDSDMATEEWEIWFKENCGNHLKSLEWFSLDTHPEWVTYRTTLLGHMAISEEWKKYLRSSGSMIEYAQLQCSYFKMCAFEYSNDIKYSYIIRARTDTIYAKPVDFHWLKWSDEQVEYRLNILIDEMKCNGLEINDKNILTYFMSTIFSDDLILNVKNIMSEMIESRDMIPILLTPSELNKYIKFGSYILTIRVNNLYVIRRDLFSLIPSIANMYGLLHYPQEDGYWFNSENQFRATCYNSNITSYNYDTIFEGKSLYEYDETRYFTSSYKLKNPHMLYCVVRY